MPVEKPLQTRVQSGIDAASSGIARLPAVPLYIVAILAIVPVVWASVFPFIAREPLVSTSIQPEQGYAYLAVIPDMGLASLFLELVPDKVGANSVSQLQVLEDGRTLGPAHVRHDSIRAEGLGRYSHWDQRVYFSSSDNSDPRRNGRAYEVAGPASPAPWVYVVGLALAALAGFRALLTVGTATRRWIWQSASVLLEPTVDGRLPGIFGNAAIFVGVIAGPVAVFLIWRSGLTVSFALAGFFPLSDASGYLSCASDIVDQVATRDWCHRRPIYPLFLASLSMLLGQDLHLVLLAQALLLSCAVVIFAREVSRWLGALFGTIAGVAAAVLVESYAINLVMTEVLGLILGMLSLVILLRAGETRSPLLAILGLASISMALNARAGAFFSLPIVLLWLVWVAWRRGKGAWRYLVLGTGAVATGFLLHGLIVGLLGGAPGASHGNFSYVVYGLSAGGDWTAIYSDHPEVFIEQPPSASSIDKVAGETDLNSRIYELAILNVLNQPDVFLSSLLRNLQRYFDWILLRPLADYLSFSGFGVVWLMGFAVTAWKARQEPRAGLVFALCVGELASAPLIAGDGGPRVFAATAAIQIMPILVLAFAIVQIFGAKSLSLNESIEAEHPVRSGGRWPRAALAMTLLIVLLFLPAGTELRQFWRTPIKSTVSCDDGLQTIVTWLKRGGASLAITPLAAVPAVWPRQINQQDLKSGILDLSWYKESIVALKSMQILIVRQKSNTGYGQEWPLYIKGEVGLPVEKDIVLCVDTTKVQNIAERPFAEIVNYREL